MTSCYRFAIGWPGLIFIILWAGGNIVLFWFTFASYTWDKEYEYIFLLVGYSISVSRGAAQALNFNCALILLPVCRNLISLLRRCFGLNSHCFGPKVICRQLDRNIFFHKIIAYSICFWTGVHYIGHSFNLERFVNAAKQSLDNSRFNLSRLPFNDNGTWVNPIRTNETNPMIELVSMIPGWSGLIAAVVLIVMVSSSTETVRRKFHELFWYAHHLFVLFYVFLIVHGFGGVVRKQTNYETHDPKLCMNISGHWGTETCPIPEFTYHKATTWMWVVGPLALYGIECIIKLVNRFRKVEIIEALIHTSDVLELKMKKSGFKSNAGQYISIMCPAISYFQWHPFTLTSAPEDDFFSVHIRVTGDWTRSLCSLVKSTDAKRAANSNVIVPYPRVSVDGPFGTCCEDVFRYNVIMLVGAGIGVTPFASILKHIWYLHKDGKDPHGLKKVYFYWICRDKAFKWFNEMLKQLEDKIEETGSDDFMSIQIYLTRGWDEDIQIQVVETMNHPVDFLTDLKSKTRFGRPDWQKAFKEVSAEHLNEEIGVFYCGPKELTKALRSNCQEFSNLMPNGRPRFVFHKENF